MKIEKIVRGEYDEIDEFLMIFESGWVREIKIVKLVKDSE